jgi:probable addiction module antidote protein/putative addiction module killer protein
MVGGTYPWGYTGCTRVIEIRQTERYALWFERIRDRRARGAILARIRRLSLGNPGDVAPVGAGIFEMRIHVGQGYRTCVILLAGGDKRTQRRDIELAKALAEGLGEGVMSKTKTTPWDAADHLQSVDDVAAYLEAALDEEDAALFAAALGDVARAKGMSGVARRAGMGRESLYKALSPGGNPELATVLKVLHSLGLRLHAAAQPR